MNIKEAYNLIAEDWHKDHQADDWWVEGTDRFISLLKPHSLVLDAGCGGGTKTRYLIKKGLQVVGIDCAEKLLAIAKREVKDATFYVCDLAEVNKLEDQFDGIFIQAVLLHVKKSEVQARLKGIVEKLNKRGYLYIAVKGKGSGGVDEEVKKENDYGYPYERFFSYYTMEELESYMNALNLEIVYTSTLPMGKTTWLQIIAKK